ncbi:sulfite exporter TauE/SafE family protein [Alteromonas sp. 1_MG-2023]|uniref:sulfite exporter TauE/SafE family protein n=1 Tax=Alteromonas sp. 1_MG-2023 TaxID=3062669 RepID=UPI0026E41F1D|nr:sulfite exporter TauE/SafE family protein [Alteromonas sp. 1_MG-2023]MDO6473928.1 sulfite exporter TauE/SafE family protein [Alteromonas sp. 1_MG-2023]
MFIEQLSFTDISIVLAIGFMVGLAKAGIHGTSLLSVPLLAILFGGKGSSGIMLPMLIAADVFAVYHYHRHANWQFLMKLFPPAIAGVLLGTWLGDHIDDGMFMRVMAVIIFASVALMLWLEKRKADVPDNTTFAVLTGVMGGFTTMVGNLAGSVMAVYLLSMRLPKNVFIGTAAWFFLVINLFKVPFHVFVWETISWESLKLNLLALPLIIAGVYCGIWLVKRISEAHYRWLVIIMTLLAALALLPG